MKRLTIIILFIAISGQLLAQNTNLSINIGYYAPYGINPGVRIGTSFQWKEWQNKANDKRTTLSISPQIGYWNYSAYGNTIHNTFNVEAHLDYKKYFTERFYGLVAAGLSYQMEFQRTGFVIDLGAGQVTPTTKTVHNIVPMTTLGIGRDNDLLGYYFKGFIGQRFASADAQNLFFGAELGLTFYLKKD
jgi:hypothetical protein